MDAPDAPAPTLLGPAEPFALRPVAPSRPRRRRQWLASVGVTGLVFTGGVARAEAVPAVFEAIADADDERPDPDILRSFAERVDAVARAAATRVAPPAPDREPTGPVSQLPAGSHPFARWDGVDLHADGSTTELVGFHESNNPAALPLDSLVPVAHSHHPGAAMPTTGEGDGQVIVLPSRRRASGPMSAIDLAVRAGAPVLAPVSGEVVDAYAFPLYGGTDHKVWIRPDGNPAALISIIHVGPPTVRAGDRVEAGVTPIASSPRQLDFESQVDRYTAATRGQPSPHVHIELRLGALA